MKRNILGFVASLAVVASVAGVALAGPDDSGPGEQESLSATEMTTASLPEIAEATTGSIPETTATSAAESGTSTTIDDDRTSTTIDDNNHDRTTSTTIDDDHDRTTSTTIDDDVFEIDDQTVAYDVPGVGQVTLQVRDNRLELVNVSAPGWTIDVEAELGEVEVKFSDDSSEVEFEAEIEHGKIEIEVAKKSS